MTQMISGMILSFSSIIMSVISNVNLAINSLGLVAGLLFFINGKRQFLFNVLYELLGLIRMKINYLFNY